jgi:hypothetical protein
MLNARRSVRSKSFLKATVRFHNRNVTTDCIVRNISLTGAKLELDRTLGLPQEFDLEIPQRGAVLQCELKWRKDDAAGVKFKDSSAMAQYSDIAKARIEALEKENATLRLEVARLSALLQQSEGGRAAKSDASHGE